MSKREEEFDVAAKRVARTKRTADAQAQCEYDFTLGCEHGYQYAVDKACEFLEKYAANFVALPDEGQQPIGDTNAIYGTKSLLYYLRKAMEE